MPQNFVRILGNDVISHFVPSLDHIDWLFVGNDIRIGSFNITIRWNIEKKSLSKLSGIFFDLCGKGIPVCRDNVEASLRIKVLLGSFVTSNVFLGIGRLKIAVWICQEQSHFEN